MKATCLSGLCVVTCLILGCATKEMKSTPFYEGDQVECIGAASDRVNLWPVAYWRNPVGSVAWPVVSFSDDHFALRPVYSQYKQGGQQGSWDEYNLAWPLVQADTKHDDYRIFPIFWGRDWDDDYYQVVFPLYWNGAHHNALLPLWYYGDGRDSWTFHMAAGLAGAHRSRNAYRSSWAFPLWYEDNTGLFTTLIYGQTSDSYWFFPLWYRGEKAFVTPLYAQGGDGDKSWWAMPELLTWGSSKKKKDGRSSHGRCLLGFGGWNSVSKSDWKSVSSWAYPFFNWHDETDRNVSSTKTSRYFAHYLAGWKTRNGELTLLYVFPLFGWWTEGWLTPLGGQTHEGGTTTTYSTPLVGHYSGNKTGGWVFPLWSQKKNADFDQKRGYMDSPTFPADIQVTVCTNDVKSSASCGQPRLRGDSLNTADRTTVLLHDANHAINGWSERGASNDVYRLEEYVKRGNLLLFNYKSERKAKFDLKTRAKVADVDDVKASLLVWLYRHDWNHDRLGADARTRHRVLWRLWDWEKRNGDISLDVFPGFTYDSRGDGYSKTSFLWRFLRYERDPAAGTSVDLLYVPIWR